MASFFQLKGQVPGKGLVFDGDDDYVNVNTTTSDELNPAESLTLECWVYLNEIPSGTHNPHLISRFNCYSLTVGANGFATAYIQNDEGDWFSEAGTTSIATHKWYHLAATYDGSNLRVFVNGEQEGITTAYDTMARTTLNFRIGARNAYVTTTNTNGIIDEARVWDIPRSQSEIRASMNRTIPGSTPGLVGYWRFDEGAGTNADCETSFDNDGTLRSVSSPSLPAWTTSTALMGETSIFAASAGISETSETAVDVDFGTGSEAPGTGFSMAVMQVNELPNTVSGLYEDRASRYWEIWSEDPDFDGDFTAAVRFHYDDIIGLPTESSLELFRRVDASGTWSAAAGYTVVSDDGGSSTGTDGIGYVQLTITENTTGDFSGQYILSWSDSPPVISDIPDETVAEGSAFATIILDDYVADPDHADDQIIWTIVGEDDVTVDITDRVASITANDPEWNGTDVVRFVATDPEGEFDEEFVTFEVTVVFDPPVVGDIPDQEIVKGASFATITLDDFVTDADNDITTLTWTATGQTDLNVDITGRVATITMDAEWNGIETITFQAADPDGETGSDQATFEVTAVNDAPVVSEIPHQTVAEGIPFATINLDDYVEDADNADSTITWSTSGQTNLIIEITDRVATVTVIDPEWSGSEIITFIAEDPLGLQDSDIVNFRVTVVNDAPVVSGIPDQTIAEGQSFSQLNLDDFVADADDPDSLITWTVLGDENVGVNIVDRVANISLDDPEWNGSDTLVFTATDTSGVSGMDTCVLTVTAINDAPTVSKAIPDTSAGIGTAFLFVLDSNTFADVDPGDVLVLSAGTPAWLTFDPASGTFSGTPADADKGMLEVIVTATDGSFASIADTFNIEIVSFVGISNPLEGLEIKLYPNPNDGMFVIESDMFELKDVVMEIFNEKGQLIWHREIRDNIGTLHESVDLSNAANGLYLLRVRNRFGMINKRFVIFY